jgi:hypothetical protein
MKNSRNHCPETFSLFLLFVEEKGYDRRKGWSVLYDLIDGAYAPEKDALLI